MVRDGRNDGEQPDEFDTDAEDESEEDGWVLPVGGKYTADDEGNADRLIDRFGEDLRYVDGGGGWHVWEKDSNTWYEDEAEVRRRWGNLTADALKECERGLKILGADDKEGDATEKSERAALKKLRTHLQNSRNANRIKSCLDVAAQRLEVRVGPDAMDKVAIDLNTGNAIVRLKSGGAEFIKPNKSRLFTKRTGVALGKEVRDGMWESFLDTFLPEDDLRAWAQKVAGYSMLGANPERRVVFCWGPTSSGKSTFVHLILEALGSYAGPFNPSMFRDSQDERARVDLVLAFPRRFIVASELSASWRLHADMIKRATGQDKMSARMPHSSKTVEVVPKFTPWLMTNNAPTIEEADQALYRRLCVVVFPHQIDDVSDDTSFREKFLSNDDGGRERRLQAVLWWLIDGWNAYGRGKLEDPPAAVVARQMQLRDEFSDFDQFLAEVCETGPAPEGFHEDRTALYDAYLDWFELNRGKQKDELSATMFGRRLSMRGFEAKQRKVKGVKIWRRLGIRLKIGHVDI
jgi:P4 family phage/plasmid primase-like protien